jgi:cation diffusion facilitator family transporter
MAVGGDRSGNVHQMHHLSSQDVAERVGIIREHHLDHFRFRFLDGSTFGLCHLSESAVKWRNSAATPAVPAYGIAPERGPQDSLRTPLSKRAIMRSMLPRKAALEGNIPAKEKRAVALSSLWAALFLTGMKAAAGAMTGSLGMLSEAAHSGLDLISALATYFSVRVADRPADSSHPFGHGKFEPLSAFFQTGLLLVTCASIIAAAVRRLFFSAVLVRPDLWAFAVMAVSIIVDLARSRSLGRAAKKFGSQALEADAIHFSTDVYSSAAVIAGLILVEAASRAHIPWLRDADPVAALVVAGIIVYIGARLGKKTVDALVDAAPAGTSATIDRAISGVPGVLNHSTIRVRGSGSQLFIDLGLVLRSNIPLEHAQAVEHAVESKVRALFPAADIIIHSAPQAPDAGDLVETIRAVASRSNFQVHDVTPIDVEGRVNLDLDLELDPTMTLEAAHQKATELETEIKREVPSVDDVNVHIEPMLRQVERASPANWLQAGIEGKLLAIARATPGLLDCHSVVTHRVNGDTQVRLHCTLERDLPIARVHAITEELEFRFRQHYPEISKVSIHAEPPQRD